MKTFCFIKAYNYFKYKVFRWRNKREIWTIAVLDRLEKGITLEGYNVCRVRYVRFEVNVLDQPSGFFKHVNKHFKRHSSKLYREKILHEM